LKSCGGKAARTVSQNGNNSTVIYRRYNIDRDAAVTTAATERQVKVLDVFKIMEFAAEDSGRYTNAKCWLDFPERKSRLVYPVR
jgi:hypothetical protein